MSIEFLITSLVVVLLPGTGVIYTVAIGLGRGFKPSVAAAVGCTFGIVPAAIASILGLAAVFHTSALAFLVIKYLGVAYLFYMAWNILHDDGMMKVQEDASNKTLFRTALEGTLLNVLNPKLSLFFLAFLPQFVPIEKAGSIAYLTSLALVFMLMTFLVFVIYGAFAAKARTYILHSPSVMRWIKRLFAGTFAALGLRLAFTD